MGDPVYRVIDKIIAKGRQYDIIYGQRPWSRGEIARILARADKKINRDDPIRPLLDKWLKEFSQDLALIHSLEVQYTLMSADSRAVPDNGLGLIDGQINPLTAYNEGRHIFSGNTLSLETEHGRRVTPYFSFYFRPRIQAGSSLEGDANAGFYVQQLYGKFNYKSLELEAGRDTIAWGQGESGGILFSNNARPFDLAKITMLFKFGGIKTTLFTANLGPEREFPTSYLSGFKFSCRPSSSLEIGVSQALVWGGDGAPGPLTFGNIMREFFLTRPGTTDLSNRELGFDFRYWFRFLRNSQLYLDIQFEDKEEKTLSFLFGDLASYHAGFYVPLLDRAGKMDLRLEYRHSSPFFYRHGAWVTGMALNRRIWGDELGPQADGAYATFSSDISRRTTLQTIFQYERRDSDLLTQAEDSRSRNRHLTTLDARPEETRWAVLIGTEYELKKNWHLKGKVGFERIYGFNFSPGDDRNHGLVQAGVLYTFPTH